MKLIVHDLTAQQESELGLRGPDVHIVADDGTIHPCIGCFGCWVKTPGQCVIRDSYGDMGALLGHCDEYIVISRCCYGGFSSFVKNVMDRSISYMHPDFRIRGGEMHHRHRYDNRLVYRVFFYGDDLSDEEKATAEALVRANVLNFDGTLATLRFADRLEEFAGGVV